jgi:hypothetical protein
MMTEKERRRTEKDKREDQGPKNRRIAVTWAPNILVGDSVSARQHIVAKLLTQCMHTSINR